MGYERINGSGLVCRHTDHARFGRGYTEFHFKQLDNVRLPVGVIPSVRGISRAAGCIVGSARDSSHARNDTAVGKFLPSRITQ
jgi:hypothetical protein